MEITSLFHILPIWRHNLVCRKRLLLPLYEKKKSGKCIGSKEKTVVFMQLKETTFCGGLSDRFRGIVSVYKMCKENGLDFRIHFDGMDLRNYLDVADYDWRINDDEICYDCHSVYPCTILTYHSNLNDKFQMWVQKCFLKRYLKKKYEQIHIYTNMATAENEYGQLFKELFRPCEELQKLIDYHSGLLGYEYDAMVFRMRQLFGDFVDGGETLMGEVRERYMNRCLDFVRQHTVAGKKLLVTSDSKCFLGEVSKIDGVYVIPGEVVHVGFTFDADKMIYMKSFVDYYVLAGAKRITLVRDEKMYHSGFATRAALLNGAEYHEEWMK